MASSCAPSSGRALGNLRTEPSLSSAHISPPSLSARAAWSRPELCLLCPRPGPAAAGQSERRGQRLVSPGLGRERVQSPGSGHHQTSEQSHRGSLHCIIITYCHTSSHNHRGLWIVQRSRRNFYVIFRPLQQLLKCLGEKSMILDKANLTKSFCKHLVFARQRV